MVRYNKNKNSLGEITVFDTQRQRSVGGTIKTKGGWFAFKFVGGKPKVINVLGTTKANAEKKLNSLFKN